MNRLSNETSPYLLQHAHNPVDWFPWGDEAFQKARSEDKPIFLSIGYSACHWCHVMERESFENEEIAAVLNREFVSIKVDREERPDVDSIYMQAVQLMTGQGGWPMSVFLTPAGRPFYAGTYFPPDDAYGVPGFRRVIQNVADTFRVRRADVETASKDVLQAISKSISAAGPRRSIDRAALAEVATRLTYNYDPEYGGFGGAPKFPPSMSLDFMMQVAWRSDDPKLREVIIGTLTKMARGGIYDQIGGGFHRYSTDVQWLAPHFEKMLYDNALLARLYTRAWQWTKEPFFARVAHEILAFVRREMTSPEGGFYSTLDADSEGVEGKFYVWDRAEIMRILGDQDGAAFCALYDVTEAGNWEGVNIPRIPREPEVVAAELGMSPANLDEIVARSRELLYDARSARVRPHRDEKILSGWNGWMLAAFADAAVAFDRDDYRDIVRANANLLLRRIDSTGRLIRHAQINGLLEDYSGAAWGLVLAYEATHERRYLDASRSLARQIVERFADQSHGGYFDTPTDHEELIARPKDLFDNATPSANSVACDVLMRLAILFGDSELARHATDAIEAVASLALRYPSAFGFLLGVAEWREGQPKEIAITGPVEDLRFRALRHAVGEEFLPHRILVAGSASSDLPLMQNRPNDRPLAYVCQAYACLEPTDDPERLRVLLRTVGQ